MRLIPVTVDKLDEWLPQVQWHLNSFVERSGGAHSVYTLTERLRQGHAQLWIAFEDGVRGVALSQLADDLTKTVTVTHAAGEGARDWAHLIQGIMAWGKEAGSQKFEIVCRPGWERHVKQYGFRKTHVVLEADYGQ